VAYPFTVVVQHHQGAGAPNNNYAFADGGYSYGIGVGQWRRFREPSQDYSTLNYNHVTMGVCLSGNRMDYPVTDMDLQMMAEIAADARAHKWIVVNPEVEPHRNMPGSNTVCPGDLTIARWPAVAAAYQLSVPTLEDNVFAFPSRTQNEPSRFRGAVVDLQAGRITLANAAACNPNPSVLNQPAPWAACYSTGDGKFTVVTTPGTWMEYAFDLP